MAFAVSSLYQQWKDNDGQPLENGRIYVGVANENPVTSPQAVYYDSAMTQPAAQPLETVNGFIYRAGTPTNVFVADNYSESVYNQQGELVQTFASASDAGGGETIEGSITYNISGDQSFTIHTDAGDTFVVDGEGNITITVEEGNTFLITGEGDTVFQTDVIMDGNTTTFINGATIILPDGSVHPENLDSDILGALVQELCVELAAPETAVSTDLYETADIRPCEFLAAMIGVDTASSSGNVTVDIQKASDDSSIFDTLPTCGVGDINSDIDGTPAVIDATAATNASLQRYNIIVTADGTDTEGLKVYLTVRWGTPMTIPPDPNNTAIPTGTILPWGSASIPTGYLQCNFQEVSRSTYSALFGVIGTTFGAGNGTTTFNVPNASGRTLIGTGSGSGLTARVIGSQGGAETVTLTAAQSGVPAHTHPAGGDGTLPMYHPGVTESPGTTVIGAWSIKDETPEPTFDGNFDVLDTLTIDENTPAAASEAHANMQPWLAATLIIKT